MRYLKRVVVSTLVYTACYLVFIAVLQALTGYDYTAAYSVGGITGVGEMALCSIIKIYELKEIKKYGLNDHYKSSADAHIGADYGVFDPVDQDEDQRRPGGAAE